MRVLVHQAEVENELKAEDNGHERWLHQFTTTDLSGDDQQSIYNARSGRLSRCPFSVRSILLCYAGLPTTKCFSEESICPRVAGEKCRQLATIFRAAFWECSFIKSLQKPAGYAMCHRYFCVCA